MRIVTIHPAVDSMECRNFFKELVPVAAGVMWTDYIEMQYRS